MLVKAFVEISMHTNLVGRLVEGSYVRAGWFEGSAVTVLVLTANFSMVE